jgi:ketosteroid isomerase-like protein
MIDPRELVERHARAFEANDWDAVRDLWHPDAELVSPSGRWPATAIPAIMVDLERTYRDVEITVTNAFGSADGRRIALEWTYASTRRSDGERSAVPDAIIIDLEDDRIRSWREYFDLSSSVESGQPAAADDQGGPARHV